MYYRLSEAQEENLRHQPETGMGYQVIEATVVKSYTSNEYIVLNSEIVIEIDGGEDETIRTIIDAGITASKFSAPTITFSSIKVLNEREFRSLLHEPDVHYKKAALENPVTQADGKEVFVRLSAFKDDKRIDQQNKCLLPGSFTTTMEDYKLCKDDHNDPIERYALPNNNKIEWAFHIQPEKDETLQRGIVQPANQKEGGGKEIYFGKGTSSGTYMKQTPY